MDDGTRGRRHGAEARGGDVAVYETCTDEACPAKREGTGHAHLVEVRRERDETVVPPA